MLPTERSELEKGSSAGVARAALWWLPGSPVYCKLGKRRKETAVMKGCRVIARLVALNVRDPARFESLFDENPSTVAPPPPPPASPRPDAGFERNQERASPQGTGNANLGTLGSLQKQQLIDVLAAFISNGLFPIDPKRVPACIDVEQ